MIAELIDSFITLLLDKYSDILDIQKRGNNIVGCEYFVYFPKKSKNAKELEKDLTFLYSNYKEGIVKNDLKIIHITPYRHENLTTLWEGEKVAETKLKYSTK